VDTASHSSSPLFWPGAARYAELEARVQAALRPTLTEPEFNALALEIHAFQREHNVPYARWCATQPPPVSWREIPAVPQAMFKRYRLACFPSDVTKTIFRTSGTTGETRGEHHFLNTDLYQGSVLAGWNQLALPNIRPLIFAPKSADAPHSSLARMFQFLADRSPRPPVWCCQPDGRLDTAVLERWFTGEHANEPVALLGTALAFLNFFEWLPIPRFPLAPGSFALETGGFKGSGRDIPKADLYAMFQDRLAHAPDDVWNEYGMCELSSQFYTHGLGRPHTAGPWLRAFVVSPETGAEVAIGDTGILRLFDLANLGSTLALQTADLAIRRETGFELLGRNPTALPRGCSRMADEAMRRSAAPVAQPPPEFPPPLESGLKGRRPLAGGFSPRNQAPDDVRPEGGAGNAPRHSSGSAAPTLSTAERAAALAKAASDFAFLGPITADSLLDLIRAELGHADILDRFVPHGAHRTRALAPATILHILSGNTPAAALQTLLRGLLLGSHNLCKVPSAGLPEVEAFLANLPPALRACVETNTVLPDEWLDRADALLVFGSDETIAHFRSLVRPGQIFVPHGHRLSLGIIFRDPDFTSIPGAAEDVSLFDQQGCLSPHVFYLHESAGCTVSEYAVRLAAAMDRYEGHTPRAALIVSEANSIRALREDVGFRAANGEPITLHASSSGTSWTVIADHTPGFPSTPLNRVIYVKPLPHHPAEAFAPIREHLSTCAVWPLEEAHVHTAAQFGATRVCRIGAMQHPALTWHQDGQAVLAPLVRWIDWEG